MQGCCCQSLPKVSALFLTDLVHMEQGIIIASKRKTSAASKNIELIIANCQSLNVCRFLIQHTNLFCAWLFNLVYSSALVLLSTWCVVVKAPQAGGAGVAEVMAYLNGCQLPKVWHLF